PGPATGGRRRSAVAGPARSGGVAGDGPPRQPGPRVLERRAVGRLGPGGPGPAGERRRDRDGLGRPAVLELRPVPVGDRSLLPPLRDTPGLTPGRGSGLPQATAGSTEVARSRTHAAPSSTTVKTRSSHVSPMRIAPSVP